MHLGIDFREAAKEAAENPFGSRIALLQDRTHIGRGAERRGFTLRDAPKLQRALHRGAVGPRLHEADQIQGNTLVLLWQGRKDNVGLRIGHGIQFARGHANNFRPHTRRGAVDAPRRIRNRVFIDHLIEQHLRQIMEMFE